MAHLDSQPVIVPVSNATPSCPRHDTAAAKVFRHSPLVTTRAVLHPARRNPPGRKGRLGSSGYELMTSTLWSARVAARKWSVMTQREAHAL